MNTLIQQKTWWQRHWKWLVPVSGVVVIAIVLFVSSGMDVVTKHVAQAYADTALYNDALKKVKADERVIAVLGDIAPIDKLAILEGQVEYSNNDKMVTTSVRIVGTKGKAKLDIAAHRVNEQWKYTKINIRIKNPPEKKQTIEIVTQ